MTRPPLTPALIHELLEIAADHELPNFTLQSNLWMDLALDSYGALSLQLEVKKVLNVEISRTRFPEIMTAQDLMDELARLLSAESPVPEDSACSDLAGTGTASVANAAAQVVDFAMD